MENKTDILIFKTNIQTESDLGTVKQLLDAHHLIKKWNVDAEDADCILRVVSQQVSAKEIISLITATGYQCQELE